MLIFSSVIAYQLFKSEQNTDFSINQNRNSVKFTTTPTSINHTRLADQSILFVIQGNTTLITPTTTKNLTKTSVIKLDKDFSLLWTITDKNKVLNHHISKNTIYLHLNHNSSHTQIQRRSQNGDLEELVFVSKPIDTYLTDDIVSIVHLDTNDGYTYRINVLNNQFTQERSLIIHSNSSVEIENILQFENRIIMIWKANQSELRINSNQELNLPNKFNLILSDITSSGIEENLIISTNNKTTIKASYSKGYWLYIAGKTASKDFPLDLKYNSAAYITKQMIRARQDGSKLFMMRLKLTSFSIDWSRIYPYFEIDTIDNLKVERGSVLVNGVTSADRTFNFASYYQWEDQSGPYIASYTIQGNIEYRMKLQSEKFQTFDQYKFFNGNRLLVNYNQSQNILIVDFVEIFNPLSDIDRDDVPNAFEIQGGADPTDSSDDFKDIDNDGLGNKIEFLVGTSPIVFDFDGDGFSDGKEVSSKTNPFFDDLSLDYDNDGLTNREEYKLGLMPNNPDTDADGANDKWEIENGYDPDDPLIGPFMDDIQILLILLPSFWMMITYLLRRND